MDPNMFNGVNVTENQYKNSRQSANSQESIQSTHQNQNVGVSNYDSNSLKNTPVYYLNLFLNYDVISWLINEVIVDKNIRAVTEGEVRCFIAILYLSGYVKVPRRRMLWETIPDTHCSLVSNAIQRDRFEAICTAFNDKSDQKENKLVRLCSLIQHLNDSFLRFAPKDDQHSIAECKLPIDTRFKTARTSVKMWCGCIRSGYCVWFDPIYDSEYGQSIILKYANVLQAYRPSEINLSFENAFYDSRLIYRLQQLGIRGSGVDRDKNCTFLNSTLGGVDRLHFNMDVYSSSVHGKTYSLLLTYALDLALHNAWQLYRSEQNKKLDLLGFRRNIVVYYLQHYAKSTSTRKGGRPPKRNKSKKGPVSDARFDGLRHYVIPQNKQTRCARCTAKTTTRCQKCDVGVHVKCFVDFHQRPRDDR